jgi:ligand-binding SRPBCC domain-containing protein
MKINIISRIPDQNAGRIFEGFDENLFRYLSPTYPLLKVNRFDGCLKGHKVEVSLGIFPGINLKWESEITESISEGIHFFSFTDVGRVLPFFLGSWYHQHIIKQDNGDVIVEDRITFSGRWFMPALLSYPMLWLSFNSRKSKYRCYFAQS